MATIDQNGIVGTSLDEYKTQFETAFQSALSDDLDLDPQSPQGQIIGILAQNASDIDDNIVSQYNALNIYNASGVQLDAFGALFDLPRLPAQPSVVTAQVTGAPTTILPAGTRAQTTFGDLFELAEEVIIDNAGQGSGEFRSVESGAIRIDANSLTQIVDVVAGWESVDNASAGTVGQPQQSDLSYRSSYFQKLAKNSTSLIESISAAIYDTTDVTNVFLEENTTDSTIIVQNIGIPSHSLAIIVEGGVAQEIGNAIYASKSDGAGTVGTDSSLQTAVTVSTNGGMGETVVYYYPVVYVPLSIQITIRLTDPNASNIIDTIRERILEYFSGTFSGGLDPADGSQQFETDGINIAETSYLSRLYTPVNSVPGFVILDMTQALLSDLIPQNAIEPNLNERLTIDPNDIGITIVS